MERTPGYLRPYEQAERIHGPHFRTTLWNSRASQRIRFEIMADTYSLAGRRVLDAGSGMGDFLAFLEEIDQPPASYVGIDALESIVAEAGRRQFRTPAEFRVGDVVAHPELLTTGSPEIVVISGMLNTLPEEQFFATLDNAFAAAEHCLLFNFLSTRHAPYHPRASGAIVRMDPARVLDHGFGLTLKIIVRHDYYDGHDCTMAWLRRDESKTDLA